MIPWERIECQWKSMPLNGQEFSEFLEAYGNGSFPRGIQITFQLDDDIGNLHDKLGWPYDGLLIREFEDFAEVDPRPDTCLELLTALFGIRKRPGQRPPARLEVKLNNLYQYARITKALSKDIDDCEPQLSVHKQYQARRCLGMAVKWLAKEMDRLNRHLGRSVESVADHEAEGAAESATGPTVHIPIRSSSPLGDEESLTVKDSGDKERG